MFHGKATWFLVGFPSTRMESMRASCALTMLLVLLLAPAHARADGYTDLGELERAAVDSALAQRGLVIEPSPEGKRVGVVHVFTQEVFQPSDGRLLTWFNHFHYTTRDDHLRRESLLGPGDAYDQSKVDETVRILRNRTLYSDRDPPLSGIVAVVPVKAAQPNTVDLLIVTRDVWSLRLNSDWNFQPGYLINFNASLSENNLLGRRKHAALTYTLNPDDMWLGPNYLDPNLLGTRVRLTVARYEIWARKIGELAAGPHEGSSSWVRVEYPLYALSQHWGAFIDGSYTTQVSRLVYGKELTYYNPTTGNCDLAGSPGTDPGAGCAYRLRTGGLSSGVTRSVERPWFIHRFTIGNEVGLNRPSFLPDFPQALRDSFAQDNFRTAERTSSLYLQYVAFTPRYRTYRNLDSFDLSEDQRLGPWLTLKLGWASRLLGSEADFFTVSVDAHLNIDVLNGLQNVGLSWDTRHYGEGWRDQKLTAWFTAYSPVIARAFRVLISSTATTQMNNIHRPRIYVGALEGVRGYPLSAFVGYDAYTAHLEVRSMALPVASMRLGGLAFADAGHAAYAWDQLQFYGDVGAGLRLLIPQLNAEVIRCDWAFPLRGYREVRPGWPGRLSIGFRQAF
jgi:hypothetical protein